MSKQQQRCKVTWKKVGDNKFEIKIIQIAVNLNNATLVLNNTRASQSLRSSLRFRCGAAQLSLTPKDYERQETLLGANPTQVVLVERQEDN